MRPRNQDAIGPLGKQKGSAVLRALLVSYRVNAPALFYGLVSLVNQYVSGTDEWAIYLLLID